MIPAVIGILSTAWFGFPSDGQAQDARPDAVTRASAPNAKLPAPSQDAPAGPAAPPAALPQGAPPMFPGRMRPEYPVPYGQMKVEEIAQVLNRIRVYLEANSPARLVNRQTREEITDKADPGAEAAMDFGPFQIISYEWGVTYSGMLLAAEATGDALFRQYADKRLRFIADLAPVFRPKVQAEPGARTPFRSVLDPRSLDDSGSMCAAMIKMLRAGGGGDLRPLIDNYIRYISTKQQRLEDGTLARSRPQPETLWLDDLYMSVPALAQMGKLTGETRYFDDAVRQILQFSDRMFVKEKGLYMHGWVKAMQPHPAFHWARANGWAVLAMTELLDVLPEKHKGRDAVLNLLRAHLRGLAACQSGNGLWNQLLDRNDSYLETSASAMFVFCMARAINRGWIDALAYAPAAQLGWNAVTAKVNAEGQVEGTCVGTGMGFDPTFYYYRPAGVFAAHGYGPVLLAGSEMILLQKNKPLIINDGAVQINQGNRESRP
jgi:unsaturated rhamnogalacturonyl hydrolase